MARTTRCPKCGLMQLAQAGCKKCGARHGCALDALGRRSQTGARAGACGRAVEEDSPYQPPSATRGYAPRAAPVDSQDSIFDRDRFLMRQRVFTIHEKYEIWDEEGRPILFVERPGHYLRNLAALFGGLLAAVIVGGAVLLAERAPRVGARRSSSASSPPLRPSW